MNAIQLVSWGFEAAVVGIFGWGVAEIGKIRTSVESLNIGVAKIVERTETHGKEIDRHDERIRQLEIKKGAI